MGYCATQIDGSLYISADKGRSAMVEVVAGHRGLRDTDYQGLREVRELDDEELIREFQSTAENCGFDADVFQLADGDGHQISLVWQGDKIGSWLENFLDTLAPHFDKGSCIVFSGEDGCVWMEKFKNGKRVQDDCSMLPEANIQQARRNLDTMGDQLRWLILIARSVAELSQPASVARGLAQQQVKDLEDLLTLSNGIQVSIKSQ